MKTAVNNRSLLILSLIGLSFSLAFSPKAEAAKGPKVKPFGTARGLKTAEIHGGFVILFPGESRTLELGKRRHLKEIQVEAELNRLPEGTLEVYADHRLKKRLKIEVANSPFYRVALNESVSSLELKNISAGKIVISGIESTQLK